MLSKLYAKEGAPDKENLPPTMRMSEAPCDFADYMSALKKNDKPVELEESYYEHYITEKVRCKIIDWVLEVIQAYKASPRTFHLCIRIMDIYCTKVKKLLPIDLYKIAVASIVVAYKYEEVTGISIETVSKKVTQGLMSKQEILSYEKRVLRALGFNLYIPTVFDFCEVLLYGCDDDEREYAHFLRDLSIVDMQLASKNAYKLAQAIFLISCKKELPTQGPLALCVQELNSLVEAFVPDNFPAFSARHGNFLIK